MGVSVALLICSSFATPVFAQDEAEAMGLMHTNTMVEMAVASSGEIHAVADDKMELMSNKHLVLQNNYIEQMETSVLFKNVEGGRCLSANVDKRARVTFEDCDDTSVEQMWTKVDGFYVSVAKLQLPDAENVCPHRGPYVNCGYNSTVLGECKAGAATKSGFEWWVTGKGNLLKTRGTKQHCLAIVMKTYDVSGVKARLVDEGYRNLVVTTPGTTHTCGWQGSAWLKVPIASTSTAIADAAAAAAALKEEADAAAKAAEDVAEEPLFKLMPKDAAEGSRCAEGLGLKNVVECQAAMEELKKSNDKILALTVQELEDDPNKPPGCFQNKKETKVYYNGHGTGQDDAGAPSVCHLAADE